MNSEERRDKLGQDLVAIEYGLKEDLGKLEEYQTLTPGLLKAYERRYRAEEKALLKSLSAKETAAYLLAKSQLLYEAHKKID